jgi:hypothetical protein
MKRKEAKPTKVDTRKKYTHDRPANGYMRIGTAGPVPRNKENTDAETHKLTHIARYLPSPLVSNDLNTFLSAATSAGMNFISSMSLWMRTMRANAPPPSPRRIWP